MNPKDKVKQAAAGDALLQLCQEVICIEGRKWFLARTRSKAGQKEHGLVFGSVVESYTVAGLSINSTLFWRTTRFGDMVFVVQLPFSLDLTDKSITETFPRANPGYHIKRLRGNNDQLLVCPLRFPVLLRD
jgi:hypothetical protein